MQLKYIKRSTKENVHVFNTDFFASALSYLSQDSQKVHAMQNFRTSDPHILHINRTN